MTLIEELLSQSKQGKKELPRQELIVDVTEQIWAALEAANMNKADLARALETSKSNVTQLLGGQRNMTLSTLADIGEVLGVKPKFVLVDHNKTAVMQQEKGQVIREVVVVVTPFPTLARTALISPLGIHTSPPVITARPDSFSISGTSVVNVGLTRFDQLTVEEHFPNESEIN